MSETNKPVYRLRYGNVVAAVWANNSQAGYFYNTTFSHVFKNTSGEWGETTTFDQRDLLGLAKAATDCFGFICQQKAQAVTVTGTEDA